MDNLYKYYKDLPPVVKGAVIIGGGILLYMVGKPIYLKLFPSDAAKKAIADNKAAEADLNAAIKAGAKPSFADSQYNAWASKLADTFSGCDVLLLAGQPVRDILNQLKNDVDFLKLQQAYGIRTIQKSFICGGNYDNLNLIQAINRQFLSIEINNGGLNYKGFNQILASKGITYRF